MPALAPSKPSGKLLIDPSLVTWDQSPQEKKAALTKKLVSVAMQDQRLTPQMRGKFLEQ